ncbi:MAG: GtrA family protein [Candidatus Komeilibacteria bacterium]|nr:GtrA family protein [Candidatus Komeilibacteria bacterium]
MINKIYKRFYQVFWQGVRFAVVGLFNTILDYAIYIGLTRFTVYFAEHWLLANIISFAFGVTSSYFLNRHFTFSDTDTKRSFRQFSQYILVMVMGSFVIVQGIFYVAVSTFEVYDLVAKALGILFGFVWNFVVARRWIFKIK